MADRLQAAADELRRERGRHGENLLRTVAKMRRELDFVEREANKAMQGEAMTPGLLTPSHQTLNELVQEGALLNAYWDAVGTTEYAKGRRIL